MSTLVERRKLQHFRAKAEPELICANCGHTKEAHWDRYGCQVEGPDVWVEGINCGGLVASGPCGCMDFEPEQEELREEER